MGGMFNCIAVESYLEGGDAVEDFLDDFPTVEREQITELFTLIKKRIGPVED
jgi:uncharacterized protein (DUF433 family)